MARGAGFSGARNLSPYILGLAAVTVEEAVAGEEGVAVAGDAGGNLKELVRTGAALGSRALGGW
jgi:hypothetical protein